MYALGLIAVNHPESNVPHQEALTLLKSASDAGSWKASAVVAVLFRDGKWISQSREDAYRYFKRAALQGGDTVNPYLRNDLQLLSTRLDEHAVATLNEEAIEWAHSHPVPIELIHKGDRNLSQSGEYALGSSAPGEHVAREIVSSLAD